MLKNQQARASLQELVASQQAKNNNEQNAYLAEEDDEEEYNYEEDEHDFDNEQMNTTTQDHELQFKNDKPLSYSLSQPQISQSDKIKLQKNSNKHIQSMPNLSLRVNTTDTNQTHISGRNSKPRSRSPTSKLCTNDSDYEDINNEKFNPLRIKSPEVKKKIYTMQLSHLKEQR